MLDLLANTSTSDMYNTPYPHLVARDVLPVDLITRLIKEFPDLDTVTQSKGFASNERHSYPTYKLLADAQVSETWKRLVQAQLTQAFLDRFLSLFGDQVRSLYPEFASEFGPQLSMRAGVRRQNSFRNADVLLEAQICVNTPVTQTTSVRGPHVDMPDKLFAGLFYLRHPDDNSQGGDLELQRYRHGRDCLHGQFIDDADVEMVDRVRYESNVLVLFLNGVDAIHAVTPREPTRYPRLFMNLFGELPRPLFDLNQYQKERSFRDRARYSLQTSQKRLVRWGHSLLP